MMREKDSSEEKRRKRSLEQNTHTDIKRYTRPDEIAEHIHNHRTGHPVLARKYHILIPLHKVPRRLHKLLHLLHAQLDVQRHEAPLGEVDVFGEHVVVEEGLEVGR